MKKVEQSLILKCGLLFAILFSFPVTAKVLAYETFRMAKNSDILIADFEGSDYGNWQVAGEAFGTGPAEGTLPNQMQVSGYNGSGLVNSFYGGDGTIGTLTSPEFKIQRRNINFLIGGGGHAGQTCINLLQNGQVVRTAAGPNTASGGSEYLDWSSWDVREYMGQMVKIEIVDSYTGGWGHINVDHIVQSDVRKEVVLDKEKEITFSKKYLILPVKNGAVKRWISVFVEGEKVREFDIELASDQADFWVYLDVSEFNGKRGIVQIDKYYSGKELGFDAVVNSDTFPGQDDMYKEAKRPQFHYTTRRGWVNDTNGLVYNDGLYHMFYQHNPYGWGWGNMTWGHAVSTDLLHWNEWSDAIHPDSLGTIFSGSAVVDHANSSGLQSGSDKTMLAFYTSAGNNGRWSSGQPFTQSMAYSTDKGYTWSKYINNPVIGPIAGGTRDPKVFWHEASGKWVMVIWIDGSKLSIFNSSDLKNWQRKSDVDGFFECPELFELPIDGDTSNTKWVVYGASGDYKIGSFDGETFIPETDNIKFEYGNCFYASQTYNNIPEADGRRIQVGWGRGIDMHGMPFNQMILFPVTLELRTTSEGVRMFVNPVSEIESIHKQNWNWANQSVRPGQNPLASISGELFHITAQLEPHGAEKCRFVIRDVPIVYDFVSQTLTCSGRSAHVALENGQFDLELLVDRMSIEIFANEGRMYMPMGLDMSEKPETLEFSSEGGDVLIKNMAVYELDSVWQ